MLLLALLRPSSAFVPFDGQRLEDAVPAAQIAKNDSNVLTTHETMRTPPLDDGFCCNGAVGIYTRMPVRQLVSAPPVDVALMLRAALQTVTPATARVGRLARWLREHHANGCRVKAVFDEQALTFIVSSWRFPWEGVKFGAAPRCFDHGAHVPIVAVLVPRRFGDGLTVYHSGQGVEAFAADLVARCTV